MKLFLVKLTYRFEKLDYLPAMPAFDESLGGQAQDFTT